MITDKLKSYGAARKDMGLRIEHRQHKELNNRAGKFEPIDELGELALRSRRTRTTVPSRIRRTIGSPIQIRQERL
jgi:transposase-like protein